MIWTLIILLLAAVSFLGWRDRAGLVPRKWAVLMALRLAAVIILGLTLLELFPRLPWSKEKQGLLVLADASQSMGLKDGRPQTRWQRAVHLALGLDLPARRVSCYRTTAEGLKEGLNDSLIDPPEYTDLSEAIYLAVRNQPGAILLLSDGDHNLPSDPLLAAAAGIPVYTVGFGPAGTSEKSLIADIWSQAEVEAGQPAEISLSLKGMTTGARASLWEDGILLAGKKLNLRGDTTLTFKITPRPEGLHRYTAALENADQQVLDRVSVTVSAVKKTFRLLIIYPKPDWNLRFLLQAVGRDPSYAADAMLKQGSSWSMIGRSGSKGPGSLDSLGNYDAMVLGSMEPGDLPAAGEQQIAALVRQKGRGLFLLGSFRPEGAIGQLAPVVYDRQTRPTPGSALPLPGLSLSSMMEEGRGEQLKRMPPLDVSKNYRIKDTKTLLLMGLQTGDKTSCPFWARVEEGSGRVVQIAADDFWRWELAAAGAGRDTSLFGDMVLASLQWALGREGRGFEAGPQQVLNAMGQAIRFNGRWRNYPSQASPSAKWSVAVSGGAGPGKELQLADLGNGGFTGDLGSLPPGTYSYSTRLETGGKRIYSSRGRFFVEPGHDERRDYLQNAALLRSLAAVSGGTYWDEKEVSERKDWTKNIRTLGSTGRSSQNPAGSILAICLLLSLEWFWRRKWGRP
jgi:hypothetical protein